MNSFKQSTAALGIAWGILVLAIGGIAGPAAAAQESAAAKKSPKEVIRTCTKCRRGRIPGA